MMTNSSRIIYSEPIANRVYNLIIQDITDNHFNQGEKLIVRELCERYGVSDTPVKQALSRLIADGIVENIPRKGMWVKRFTMDQLVDMYKARLMIEEYCIDSCIELISKYDNVRKQFEDLINEYRQFIEDIGRKQPTTEDYNKSESLDIAFHYSIVACSNSPSIQNLYDHLHTHIHLRLIRRPKEQTKMGSVCTGHERIYKYLICGDAHQAKAALREHFEAFFIESGIDIGENSNKYE